MAKSNRGHNHLLLGRHRLFKNMPQPNDEIDDVEGEEHANAPGPKRWSTRRLLVGATKLILCIVTVTIVALVANAQRMGSRQLSVEAVQVQSVDDLAIAQALEEILSEPSTAHRHRPAMDPEPFRRIHAILRRRFPRVHETVEVETVNDLSLLYRWPGQDTNLEPILLMSHLDVVPVDQQSLERWTDKKGEARIDEKYVWGRGALDVKCGVVAILAAAESLLEQGFHPQRTIYFAFGHDEEVGGNDGNGAIAQQFQRSGLRFSLVLDEGGAILDGIVPGVKAPVAFVGIAEKRYAELKITAIGEGGHGSMPGQSAILNLVECISRIEQKPMPVQMTEATWTLFRFLGPEMPLLQRTVVGNRALFQSTLMNQLSRKPTTNAVVRTTTNVTQISSASAENQNATTATATINARLLPGTSPEDVRQHLLRITSDILTHDPVSHRPRRAIQCDLSFGWHGEHVSPTECGAFRQLQTTIHQIFPDVTVAAGLTSVSTDSAWYHGVSDHIYRFIPMRVGAEDVTRIHGIDERIGIENLGEIVRFYIQLLRNTAGQADGTGHTLDSPSR